MNLYKLIRSVNKKHKVFNGRTYVKFMSKESPFYVSGGTHKGKDFNIQSWKIFGRYISIRKNDYDGFTEYGERELRRIFTDALIDGRRVIADNLVYYIDDMKWLFNGDEWRMVKGEGQVMYNVTEDKYYGFSHRAIVGFGIGDTLFDVDAEDKKTNLLYAKNAKYRKAYIKALKRYDAEDDGYMFDDCIRCGITEVVPFRERGVRKIENTADAILAAHNFADYVS